MSWTMEFTFDSTVTSVIAVEKACYFFMEYISSEVTQNDNLISCKIHFKDKVEDSYKKDFEIRFRDEVLDNSLREKIASETAEIRALVLGLAFSNTGIQIE